MDSKAALILTDSVVEATRLAVMEMKNKEGKGGKAIDGDKDDDDDGENNKDMKLFGKKRKGNFAHQKGFANKSFARKRKRV